MDITEVIHLAQTLLEQHNLVPHWRFEFSRSKTVLGKCNFRKQIIYVSKSLAEINDRDRTENTLKHEIAHALAGAWHGHNRVWRQIALNIGCDGKICASQSEIKLCPKNAIGTCGACGYEIKRYRKMTHAYHAPCGLDSGTFIWNKISP
jgi:predicted SprT family Zn-dependent metalloprotease